MNHSMLQPLSRAEVASAARTATGNSGTLTLPQARTYEFILSVTAASGGNDCTLDVAIQNIPESPGTPVTYLSVLAFSQVLQSTVVEALRVSPSAGASEAGAAWKAWSSTIGGPIAMNGPLTRKYRILWTMQGASPSYTFAVYLIMTPKGSMSV